MNNYLIDRKKLRAKMYEKSMSVEDLSRKLSITRQSTYLKINGTRMFTETEIVHLKSFFGKDIFLH